MYGHAVDLLVHMRTVVLGIDGQLLQLVQSIDTQILGCTDLHQGVSVEYQGLCGLGSSEAL